MGKGDIQANIAERDSVKEDLFEAILGTVALDCAWDMQEIFETAEIMLEPEQYLSDGESENYVEGDFSLSVAGCVVKAKIAHRPPPQTHPKSCKNPPFS